SENIPTRNTKVKDPTLKLVVKNELSKQLTSIRVEGEQRMEHTWERFKTAVRQAGDKHQAQNTMKKRQPWITDDILELMNLRRTFK
ncbi:hypothetical protein HHI36_015441, partial [Cryptolaemus montrouzieri]